MEQQESKSFLRMGNRLYLGHPLAEKLYLTNIALKCHASDWDLSLTKLKDTIVGVKAISKQYNEEDLDFSQERTIKGCPALLLSDFDVFDKLSEADLNNLLASCKKYKANPNFLTFEEYTDKVLKDHLRPLDTLEKIDVEEATKYVHYREKYDADLKYSDKEVPYWVSAKRVNLFLFAYEEEKGFLIKLGYSGNTLAGIKIELM